VGRVALVTQGALYVVIGLLTLQVAAGDYSAKPSQRGAIETIARQPFGRALLVILLVGLVAHALWRLALAIRGEADSAADDSNDAKDDAKETVKRLANVGRAAIYVGFALAAWRILVHHPSGGDDATQRSTARVMEWPGGSWLLLLVGLALAAAGIWNMSKVVTAKFMEHLDVSGLDERHRRTVDALGRVGYFCRGVVYCLVAWFLIVAARQHDAGESRGLDDSLRELKLHSYGTYVLVGLAIGMLGFGLFRMLDARYRKQEEMTYS
jgi:hypothetical protein